MTGLAGKPRNIVLVWLVWPFLTLGVYALVWYYKINREARDFDPRTGANPLVSLLAVLIGWIIIVPPLVSIYRTGRRIAQMQRAAGLTPTCNGWIGLILWFVAGLSALYYQHELNRIWAHFRHPDPGSRVSLQA
jgi:Domain of unknown function (DUF4234)